MVAIRSARKEDAALILSIYAPYVERTAITFEYSVPTLEEMEARIEKRRDKYPFLVLEEDGEVKGYAYLSPFKEREAYSWSSETSIYLKMDERKRGLGSILLSHLEEEARKMGLLSLEACVAIPREESPYLSDDSMFFHARHGYSKVAHFPFSGYKFDTWFDVVWMEKIIGEHSQNVKGVTWYGDIKDKI